ncbi:hypothetical protein Q3G72_027688 [Acer saccharum]|nr:hypothetical protein Q3G72_027688 [Acer saccharum]
MQNMSTQLDLNKSFKLSVCSILTTSSKQDFRNAFAKFSTSEKVSLHRLFIQVVTFLHGNIEVLDTVKQLVEELGLDPLFSEKVSSIPSIKSANACLACKIS